MEKVAQKDKRTHESQNVVLCEFIIEAISSTEGRKMILKKSIQRELLNFFCNIYLKLLSRWGIMRFDKTLWVHTRLLCFLQF